jgi:hypothetical protein
MEIFAASIKEKYQERLINREKQWPPCHSNKLVRLELVEREKGEGYFANQQRGRGDRADKRTPLAYGDLFKVESEKKPVRKVLVEGDAGIGKTTLCIAVSEDWANGKLFQQFELVLLLPLRMKAVASAGSLPELLKLLHPSPRLCDSVARYLEDEEGESVLIIADGWDELGESQRQEGSFLYQFLFGQRFCLMSVVVTSRPSASAPLRELPDIDRFVEVCGFSKEHIAEYIQSEFTSDQGKADRLREQLEDNPLVESVCSVPLNCAIVCHLWRTLEEALPTTMTELYTKIILNVILRNIQKIDAFHGVKSLSSFDALSNGLQQPWRLLCEFAFQAIEKDQIVFSQEELVDFFPRGIDLDENILCFGLLQSAEFILDTGRGVSFHFLHLTFQEFLAALHLANQLPTKQPEIYPHITLEYFDIVWRFLFGICVSMIGHSNCSLFIYSFIDTVSEVCYMYRNKSLVLLHCAFEAKNEIVNNIILNSRLPLFKIMMSIFPRTAHDCTAILHFIANMQECSRMWLYFGNSGVREDQIRTLTDALASRHGRLQVTRLDLSGNKLSDKRVSDLLQRASAAFHSLEILDLSDVRIGAENIKSIISEMAKSPFNDLSVLCLSHNTLGVSGLQGLEDAVSGGSLANLQELYLQGCLTNDADINGALLATSMKVLLSHCHRLRHLDLSQNNLGLPGASALAIVISQCQKLTGAHSHSLGDGVPNFVLSDFIEYCQYSWSVNMNETNLGDSGVCAFVESLESPCLFACLQLADNGIHATGVSCLANGVCSGKVVIQGESISTLRVLDKGLKLHDNPLGLESAVAINRMFNSSNYQYDSVSLSRCQLTKPGGDNKVTGEAYVVGLELCQKPQSSIITMLILDCNSFSGESIHILAGFMYLCPCLTSLYSRLCGITSDDLLQLLDQLTELTDKSSVCSQLGCWCLNDNEIDDSGVSALMEHLSLFPRLGYNGIHTKGIFINYNPVSDEMKRRLNEKIKGRNETHEITRWTMKGKNGVEIHEIRPGFENGDESNVKQLFSTHYVVLEFQRQWEAIVDLLYEAANDMFCRPSLYLEVMGEEEEVDTPHHNNNNCQRESMTHTQVTAYNSILLFVMLR